MDDGGNHEGWTADTLLFFLSSRMDERDRQYQQRFDDMDRAMTAALTAAQAALEKAEQANNARFSAVQVSNFLPRAEYQVQHNGLVDRLTKLEANYASSSGRSTGFYAAWAVAVGAIVSLITIIAIIVGYFH